MGEGGYKVCQNFIFLECSSWSGPCLQTKKSLQVLVPKCAWSWWLASPKNLILIEDPKFGQVGNNCPWSTQTWYLSMCNHVIEMRTQKKSEHKIFVLIMRKNILFYEEIYTPGKHFTLPPAVTNLTSGNTVIIWRHSPLGVGNLFLKFIFSLNWA